MKRDKEQRRPYTPPGFSSERVPEVPLFQMNSGGTPIAGAESYGGPTPPGAPDAGGA